VVVVAQRSDLISIGVLLREGSHIFAQVVQLLKDPYCAKMPHKFLLKEKEVDG